MNMLMSNKYGVEPGITRGAFFKALLASIEQTEVYGGGYPKRLMKLDAGLKSAKTMFQAAHSTGNKLIFVGNGGSCAIASHMAADFTKNGPMRSVALNDAPTLTCLGNDFGYDQVFAKQIEYYGQPGDVVVIISTSGKSPNILQAAAAAKNGNCEVVTFSGMRPDNGLRQHGSLNFYVPSHDYGLVELSHNALLHSIVSIP